MASLYQPGLSEGDSQCHAEDPGEAPFLLVIIQADVRYFRKGPSDLQKS